MRSARYARTREPLFLALLGIATGLCAGIVSVAFRATIELAQSVILPAGGFSDTVADMRFLLPIVGSLLSIVAIYVITGGPAQTGVAHVVDRLEKAGARLPVAN